MDVSVRAVHIPVRRRELLHVRIPKRLHMQTANRQGFSGPFMPLRPAVCHRCSTRRRVRIAMDGADRYGLRNREGRCSVGRSHRGERVTFIEGN